MPYRHGKVFKGSKVLKHLFARMRGLLEFYGIKNAVLFDQKIYFPLLLVAIKIKWAALSIEPVTLQNFAEEKN